MRAIGVQFDWKLVIFMSSLACLTAAGLFAFVLQDGPHKFSKTKVDLNQLGRIIKDRSLMLVNIGYFGHMWELYAMWGWFFVYAIAAKSTGLGLENAALLTFSVIAAGAPDCVLGGWLADRLREDYGNARFTDAASKAYFKWWNKDYVTGSMFIDAGYPIPGVDLAPYYAEARRLGIPIQEEQTEQEAQEQHDAIT